MATRHIMIETSHLETSHPTDRMGGADPFLIGLQSYREAAQLKRDADDRQRNAAQQRKQREQHSEQLRAAIAETQRATPREVMAISNAERFLAEMTGGQ
nr:hypothetical protein FIICPACM_00005 [Methanosarcinales archaeon ANME-2c ERB4]